MTITLISIIIPAYNVENYITECISSVICQMQAHYELIVVNDGSLDATGVLIDEIKERYQHINFSVIHQANQGVAQARNQGLNIAKGDYVLWLDADDILVTHALEELEKTILDYQPDIISFDLNYWNSLENKRVHNKGSYQADCIINDKNIILASLFHDGLYAVWLKVFKRDFYQRHQEKQGIVFQPTISSGEDLVLVPQLLWQCNTFIHLAQGLIDYRDNPNSITRNPSAKHYADMISSHVLAFDFLKDKQINETVKFYFDIDACYFYRHLVRGSYDFDIKTGIIIRQQLRQWLLTGLFHDYRDILLIIKQGNPLLADYQPKPDWAKKIAQAMNNNPFLHARYVLKGKIKRFKSTLKKSRNN